MAEDHSAELLRLVLAHKEKHGEKDAWVLLTLALVCLDQMVRLIETKASSPAAATPETGAGKGLFDLLGALGPLMGAFKTPPHASPPEATVPAAAAPAAESVPTSPKEGPEEAEEVRPGETRRGGVIKWDPRLVGGGRQ